jgi:hypothetical protein
MATSGDHTPLDVDLHKPIALEAGSWHGRGQRRLRRRFGQPTA